MKGGKRFGCFWACVISLSSLLVYSETDNTTSIVLSGVFIFLLLLSVGNRDRVAFLLTVMFFVGSVVGVIYWSWWAIPVSFGLAFAIAWTYRRWVSSFGQPREGSNLDSEVVGSDRSDHGPLYAGGDGSTPQKAVLIQGVNSNRQGVQAEYEYLRRIFGERGKEWELKNQSVFQREDGSHIDKITVIKSPKEEETIYFDVSNLFGK